MPCKMPSLLSCHVSCCIKTPGIQILEIWEERQQVRYGNGKWENAVNLITFKLWRVGTRISKIGYSGGITEILLFAFLLSNPLVKHTISISSLTTNISVNSLLSGLKHLANVIFSVMATYLTQATLLLITLPTYRGKKQ